MKRFAKLMVDLYIVESDRLDRIMSNLGIAIKKHPEYRNGEWDGYGEIITEEFHYPK